MADCIFCKIVDGEIPAEKVYEDDDIVAFEDINPVAPVHVLLIPKKHVSTLNDATAADQAVLGHLMLQAKNIARDRNIAEDGYRVVMNCMAGAGQAVFHIHLHLIAGRRMSWPPG